MNLVSIGDPATDERRGKSVTLDKSDIELYLRKGVLGTVIKQVRKKRNMTQSELGKLLGVQRAQISKLENNRKDFRIGTVLRAIEALGAKVKLSVEIESPLLKNPKQ